MDESWVNRLRAGDSVAAQVLWEIYYRQLTALIRSKLALRPFRDSDEDDVVNSALGSFFKAVDNGRIPQLQDRDDLWKVLVVMSVRKLAEYRRRAASQKRGGTHGFADSEYALEGLIDREPTPELAAEIAENIERLLGTLADERLRRVVSLKLEGYTNSEVAEAMSSSVRSIERSLSVIRALWREMTGMSDSIDEE